MIDSSTHVGSAPGWRKAAIAGLVMAVAVTGCSSSKKNPGPASQQPDPTATAAGTQTTSSGPGNADVTAIKTVYSKFFNPKTSIQESISLLQDGAAFRGTLEEQAKTSFAKTASVTVSKVTVDSPNKATIVYTILLSGSPVLPNTTGFAVREGGTWKIAGATFCGLLAAQGAPPPVCSQRAATSVPN